MAYSVRLVMIVRDEERSLARALTSVAPYVDEAVVVDTGSTDATVEIARAHGARLATFEWVDDFAAARNHALEIADADWSLILDASLADPSLAPDMLPIIENAWQSALTLGDQPHLSGSVRGRGSFLAATNLAALYEATGDQPKADHMRALAAELRAEAEQANHP